MCQQCKLTPLTPPRIFAMFIPMSASYNFTRRYLEYLNDVKTVSVFGFRTIFAWAAAIPTPSSMAKLVATACYGDTTPNTAALAIISAIHARICISLGIMEHSQKSTEIYDDVIIAVSNMSHLKRSLSISLIPASITALGALAYYTLITPLQSASELALGIICPSLLILMASLVACTLFIPTLTIVLHPASGTQVIKVPSDSPYYELLRLFAKSVNNPDDLSFTYAIQDIADKVSLKYRIPHLHSMSDSLDGIPDQYVFEHESKEHPFHTTPMSSTQDDTPMSSANDDNHTPIGV